MKFEWDIYKEETNIRKHGFYFSISKYIASDPLSLFGYDRYEGGEHRYHAIGIVDGRCLVLVHTTPDPDENETIRVIGLRIATARERKRYEDGRHK